jgi:hypothetical protein
MRVDSSILDPPRRRVLDVLDRKLKVLLELVLELGGDGAREHWEIVEDVPLGGLSSLKTC